MHGVSDQELKEAFEGAGLKEVEVRKRVRVSGSKKDGEEGEVETKYILVASGVKA